jgi:crotonobetainyl-CoA:carnitine CoA-transferase CaiB-like acyl-CoA transferase
MSERDGHGGPAGPLSGLVVLDLGQAAVGPVTASYLGMLGATVIKVESPRGDVVRHNSPQIDGTSMTFMGNNLTKRGVVVDLKSAEGKEQAKRLIAQADVLIENFRGPDVMVRLGLGYDVLSQVNPRLIYVQSSAFGATGPWTGMFSHEWVTQAASGAVSVMGDASGNPEFSRGTAHFDWSGAMMNLVAILAGLHHRRRTGRGLMIQTAQMASGVFSGITRMAELFATGEAPRPMGSARPNIVPDQSFQTSDDYINVCVPTEKFWPRLCAAIERPELVRDPRFFTNVDRVANRDALVPLLDAIFRTRATEDWLVQLRSADVPCGPHPRTLRIREELLANPQIAANRMLVDVDTPWGRITSAAPQWSFEKTPAAITRPSPLLGQHTDEVFAEFGIESSSAVGARPRAGSGAGHAH